MQTVLKTTNINKYFHEPHTFQVLKEISIEIKKGEFLSLMGKSGCGKSTLMYVLSTMDTDYEGKLEMVGEVLSGQRQDYLANFRNRHIGFVFQFHFLLPEFTALQNVMIPALKLGKFSKEEIEARALQKLEILGVRDQASKSASKLSGGQQQRVAIARALINDPDLLMGDEPTGNLDSYNSGLVLDIFKQLTGEYGQTILAVTHDEDFAKHTHRVIEMSDGKIL
jgi:lipoprotein-releasing system ATP-binding protein